MDLVQTPRTIAASGATPEATDVLRPRRAKGLVNEVVESLAASIREGAIQPGDKLPTESEIMGRFDVSRTVVREAISRLQANRLVETRHGVGTFALAPQSSGNFQIADVDFATVADVIALLELRISLETEAAGLAAGDGLALGHARGGHQLRRHAFRHGLADVLDGPLRLKRVKQQVRPVGAIVRHDDDVGHADGAMIGDPFQKKGAFIALRGKDDASISHGRLYPVM